VVGARPGPPPTLVAEEAGGRQDGSSRAGTSEDGMLICAECANTGSVGVPAESVMATFWESDGHGAKPLCFPAQPRSGAHHHTAR